MEDLRMKWNDAEIYFATESAASERQEWEARQNSSGKYALYRDQELIGVFEDTATAIAEGHRRFGDHFVIQPLGDTPENIVLGVFPAFPDDEGGM
jgi:hypothetical protein